MNLSNGEWMDKIILLIAHILIVIFGGGKPKK